MNLIIREYHCPRDRLHSGVIKDLAGRRRCANREVLSGEIIHAYEWEDPLSKMKKMCYKLGFTLESEKKVTVVDVCYALLPKPRARSHS